MAIPLYIDIYNFSIAFFDKKICHLLTRGENMDINSFCPYVRRAEYSVLTHPFIINTRVIYDYDGVTSEFFRVQRKIRYKTE